MQNISWEQHSPIIIRLETFQRLYKKQLKCRKTYSKDPLPFINENKYWNKMFTSPASVLWAQEAFCLFCLHSAYPTLNSPDLQTRAGAHCRWHSWCTRPQDRETPLTELSPNELRLSFKPAWRVQISWQPHSTAALPQPGCWIFSQPSLGERGSPSPAQQCSGSGGCGEGCLRVCWSQDRFTRFSFTLTPSTGCGSNPQSCPSTWLPQRNVTAGDWGGTGQACWGPSPYWWCWLCLFRLQGHCLLLSKGFPQPLGSRTVAGPKVKIYKDIQLLTEGLWKLRRAMLWQGNTHRWWQKALASLVNREMMTAHFTAIFSSPKYRHPIPCITWRIKNQRFPGGNEDLSFLPCIILIPLSLRELKYSIRKYFHSSSHRINSRGRFWGAIYS